MQLDIAMQWNNGYYEGIHGYANGISTTEGGMHVEGFKTALTSVINKYARDKGLLKEKDDNLLGEDIREGITAIIAVKFREPQFEGQTKGNAFNWRYTLALPVNGSILHVHMDDWMYLMNDRVMLNKARMTKLGIHLGDVTLSFTKRA